MGKIFSTSIKRKHISASMDVGKWTCVAVEYLKWHMQNEYLKGAVARIYLNAIEAVIALLHQ
jgi:hypothetical protein